MINFIKTFFPEKKLNKDHEKLIDEIEKLKSKCGDCESVFIMNKERIMECVK